MTLEQAIRHCLNVADTCTVKACAEDHRQLAEWLEELNTFYELTDGLNRDDTVTVGWLRDAMWGEQDE